MRKFLKIILSLILMICFSSCEKVIKVNLNEADSKIVIEGIVTDRPGPYSVKVSKTANYFGPNDFPAVTNAIVMISDNVGNSEILIHSNSGIYLTSTLQGTSGRTYYLSVTSDGVTYTAEATLPQPVDITAMLSLYDSVGVVEKGYYVVSTFLDPTGQGNHYRSKIFKNDIASTDEQKKYWLQDDKFTDGNFLSNFYYTTIFQKNDSAKVELISLDQGSYDYYRTLVAMMNNNSSTVPPDNPVSNLSNDALGFFGAHAIRKKSLFIQ